jgi:hypothetical protein
MEHILAAIPGDALPAELVPDLRGAGVDPERLR